MNRPTLWKALRTLWWIKLLCWRLAARQVLGGLYTLALWRLAHWCADRLSQRHPRGPLVRIMLVPRPAAPGRPLATVLPFQRRAPRRTMPTSHSR